MLTSLLDQSLDIKHDLTVTALVRQAYQVSILKDAGVEAEVFGGLDEVEVIKKAAREVDGMCFLIRTFGVLGGKEGVGAGRRGLI